MLANDPLVQLLFHVHEPSSLFFGQAMDRNTGPLGENASDLVLVDHRTDRRTRIRQILLALFAVVEERALLVAKLRSPFELLGLNRLTLVLTDRAQALVDLFHLRAAAFAVDTVAAPCLVDEVDRLVRQEAVGDIAVGQIGGQHECGIGEAHLMVGLVTILEAMEDLNRLGHGRLLDLNRLETALESRVLFEVLAILLDGGGPDGLQLAAGQHRLEDAGGIDGAFRGTRPDEGVDLVDEQNDVAPSLDLFQHLLEALFEITAVAGTGNQCTEIERVELLGRERVRDVPGYDLLGQTFHDRRLPHTRLTDEHRVVLRTTRQDLHDPFDLRRSADHRVQVVVAGHLCQVAAELIQYRGSRRRRLA